MHQSIELARSRLSSVADVGGKDDQRLKVDRLPIVAPSSTVDAELGPQAPCKIERELGRPHR